jgi:flagellar M-ring protein FliF
MAAMIAVSVMMLGFFAFIILRWNSPHMVTLFSELSLRDSSQVVRELERTGISYDLKYDGTVIQVPSTEVAKLRMRLAEQGLPHGSGVGYEIFDKSEALGTTSFVQNINHLRAMEGELARSINEIDHVQSARVHLVMPERQLFAHEKNDPTASIVLKLRNELTSSQVKAIQHLVASAVPGMKPDAVSIVDEAGRLLASGRDSDESMMAEALQEKAVGQETRLKHDIEDILSRIVGPGRSKVQVTADLDWNRVTQTQDLFDPESRAIRSTQTREEKNQSGQPGGGQPVSIGTELPGAAPTTAAPEPQNKENGEKNEETINYEISRTSRTEILEAGRVKRISVAVLVDGTYAQEGDKLNYTPRPQEELDRIASLVRSAIGFDEKRGDKVEIVNLRFADAPKMAAESVPAGSLLSNFTMEDYFRIAEMAVIFILGLLMVLFGVRPLLRSVLEPSASAANQSGAIAQSLSSASVSHSQSHSHAPAVANNTSTPQKAPAQQVENATTKALEVAMVTGSMHKESLEKVGDLVKNNPKEAAAVIRSWIGERAA